MSTSFEQLEAIFGRAIEFRPEERAAFLAGACGGDPELRAKIQAMLHAHEGAEGFLPEAPQGETQAVPLAGKPGDRIGHYKLLQQIGEGGCGVVYMAEQEHPVRRRVALKIIKLGMDTKQVVARFEAERQALALMDHPNIAQVLDAGATEAGRPYFVMELVRGVKITDYCDQNRLPTAPRLDLFIQVCRAIQHAHQKGIIHRDIKPSNILVTINDGVAVPKVIDFGIAKATQGRLTDQTMFTAFEQFIGTPAYMSPEQATMTSLDIDTRSDIYSLGVLLYELLTGQTPFDTSELLAAGLDEMRRTICEQEPLRPSTRLRRTALATPGSPFAPRPSPLATDLDWIVMKCLEKDRTRRYATSNGLAADLQRHLDNEPVVARPPSAAYRLQKLVRRNKLTFTAGAAVAAALVVGIGISTWQAVVATRAKTKAVAAQKETQQAKEAEKSIRIEAQHQLYLAKMNLAQQAWEQNNIGRLQELLVETQDSPYRGFEWYYWQQQIHLSLKTLRGHFGVVWSVAFSPDGQRIVTGSWDHTAKVWDAASGRELLTLTGHSDLIWSVAFSFDGQRIVTGSHDAMAKVWEVASGKELLTLRGHGRGVQSAAFSPDGRRIVTGSYDNTAKIWEAASGKELLTLAGHSNRVCSVGFSPDGQRVVTGSWDQTARVWDAASGKELFRLMGNSNFVSSVAFSPDGRRIVTGSDQTARVWEAATGKELLTLKGHGANVLSVAFSSNGQRIVTGSWDQTARVWDSASGNELFTLKGHGSGVQSVAFSPDGRRIVTGSADNTAKVWEAASNKDVFTIEGHSAPILFVAFSPNGQRIVSASEDKTAKVWEAASGKELLALAGHSNCVNSAAFSPDGRRIVTGSDDKTAKVWEAGSGKELLTLKGHSNCVNSVAYSPDGRRIVTGSDDKTAKVWDAASGVELLTLKGHSGFIYAVAYSPDGRRIVTGTDGSTATVWEAASGKELLTLKQHAGEIFSVAFSPDGQRIVTGSGWDEPARVWDAANGKELLKLKAHIDAIRSVAFSPDGQRIVTGSWDRTARVWEADSGRELLILKGQGGPVLSVAFSPDGQRIVTGSRDGTARVWKAAGAAQVAAWRQEDELAKTFDLLKQGSDFKSEGQLVEAGQLLTRLLTNANVSAAQTAQILASRANVLARSGRWEEAAADLAGAIEHDPADHSFWHSLAPILVKTGQLKAYREHCRKSLERFGKTTDQYTADRIAKDCLILPDSGANLDAISTMADTAVAQGQHSPALPYFQFCKGLAEYRLGRFTGAAVWMGTVLTNAGSSLPRDTEAYMVLAMSQYRLGQIEQARASLAKGAEIEQALPKLESGDLGGGWIDWIIAHALMREATGLLGPTPAQP